MQVIAIDDEPLALDVIKRYAQQIDYLDVIAVFTDAFEAQEYLNNNSVDLIFLDIQMPEVTGLSFYKSINNPPEVIFTTAFSHYAVEGFNLDAVDYLLKPFDFSRFLKAVEKAKTLIDFKQSKEIEEGFLLVKYNYQWQKIAYKNIEYIEALDDYIKIHVQSKPFLIHMSMKAVTEKLPFELFKRVHRSYIVSLDKISSWNKNSITINQKVIPISSTYQKQVLEILKSIMDEN